MKSLHLFFFFINVKKIYLPLRCKQNLLDYGKREITLSSRD